MLEFDHNYQDKITRRTKFCKNHLTSYILSLIKLHW